MALNPLSDTVPLVGRLMAGSGDDGTDDPPERWDTSSKGSRITGTLKRYSYLSVASVFGVIALLLFFVPVLPTAHHNGAVLVIAGVGMWSAVVYYMGRTSAFGRLRDFDVHILFTGNSIRARLGKETSDLDDRTAGFKVLKSLDMTGLSTAYEQFRDRYSRREIDQHKEKYHRVETDGRGEVVDGLLKQITFEASRFEHDIDLFNSVKVTHAGSLETDMASKQRETMTTLPPTLDQRTNSAVRLAFQSQVQSTKEADRLREMTEDYLDEIEEYVDPDGKPIFNMLVEMLREMGITHDRQQSGETPDRDGDLDLEEIRRKRRQRENGNGGRQQ